MQDALLNAYERELGWFRSASLEFAAAHPAIAGHLGLEAGAAVDPFVERLLEGAAFMSARVRQRLDRSVDHFAEFMLDRLLPSVGTPLPSAAIVRLDPGAVVSTIGAPITLPRGSGLRLTSNAARSRPYFLRTTQAVTLRPLTVEGFELMEGAAALRAAGLHRFVPRDSGGALRVTWQVAEAARGTPHEIDELSLYFDGVGQAAPSTLATLCTNTRRIIAVSVANGSRQVVGDWPPEAVLELDALRRDSALLPESETELYAGFRLLQEYFLLPERFRLLSIRLGLRITPPVERIELYFVFETVPQSLTTTLERTHLVPWCVPVVNLFSRALDRAPLEGGIDQVRLVVDRTRATDYEVVRVQEASAWIAGRAKGIALLPLYAEDAVGRVPEGGALRYSTHREMHRPSPDVASGETATGYRPSETWLSVIANEAADFGSYTHVAVRAWVSNRERCYEAVRAAGGYTLTLDDPLPVESVSFMVTPTPPEAGAGSSASWRLLGALRMNYFSLFGDPQGEQASTQWRTLLALFAEPNNRFAGSIIAGITRAAVNASVERLPGSGPLAFARGADVALDVDRNLADSGQYFALGAILDVLLAGYASVNSFSRLSVRDTRGQLLHRWPVRLGLHECL